MQFCRFRCRFNRGGYGPSSHASGPPYRLTIELVIAETKRSPAPSALFFVSFCCSDNTDKTALPRAALCVAWISRRKRRLLSVSTFSSPASYKTLFSMCFFKFSTFSSCVFRVNRLFFEAMEEDGSIFVSEYQNIEGKTIYSICN